MGLCELLLGLLALLYDRVVFTAIIVDKFEAFNRFLERKSTSLGIKSQIPRDVDISRYYRDEKLYLKNTELKDKIS